jgi:phage baseplate assembly protein W
MAKTGIGLLVPIRLGSNGYFETTNDTFEQVRHNIRNILLTRPGERRFNNSFGSSMYKYLFEQMDFDVSREILVDVLQKDMNKFFNGVLITDVDVQLENNQENNKLNTIFINVSFRYKETQSSVDLEITS